MLEDQTNPDFYRQPAHIRDAVRMKADANRPPPAPLLAMALGTSDERQAARRAQVAADAIIDRQVAQRAAGDAGPVSPYAARISELEQKLPYAVDKESIERRLRMYRPQHQAWQQQQEAAERKATFDADPSIINLRAHSEAWAKTPPLGADPQQVALTTALAFSERFSSPLDAKQAYWQAVETVEQLAYQSEALKLIDTAADVGRNLTAMGEQQAAVQAAEARLAQAKLEGGTNGP